MAQKSYRVLGTDLALTRYTGVPGSLELRTADSWGSLDLSVVPGGQGGLRKLRDTCDLGTADGRASLGQALVLRLLTPLGALAPLGHPDYGCRLVELIGRLNDQTTRNLARLYTLQALQGEPASRRCLTWRCSRSAASPR